jgi:hypothetical protein
LGIVFALRAPEKLCAFQEQTSLFAIALTLTLFPLKICLSQISLGDTFVIPVGRARDRERCRRQISQWELVQMLRKKSVLLSLSLRRGG